MDTYTYILKDIGYHFHYTNDFLIEIIIGLLLKNLIFYQINRNLIIERIIQECLSLYLQYIKHFVCNTIVLHTKSVFLYSEIYF